MSDTRLFVQNQATTLAGSGAIVGATSITLTTFTQVDGTTKLAMTDFGTKGYLTLEPGSSTQEEAITFTGLTQNASGTTTLTGVSTQLMVSPYTETSGLAKAHPGGAKVVVTNTAGFYDNFANKADDETITGLWAFPNGTNNPTIGSSYVAPTAATQAATKQYVDSVVAGTANYDQNLISGVAGTTLAAGNLVYLKVSDGRWWLADATVAATINNIKLGFAQGTATAGNSVNILIGGIDKNQSGLTAGTVYYATNTPGSIGSSAGTSAWVVGQALTTTQFILDPNFTYIPTSNQKAAMVGTSGTQISGSNKLVDASDVSSAAASGKIVRATGTALPALSGINLVSTSIAGAFVTGQVQGDVLYKGSTGGWSRLAAGTSGQFLKTQGAAANPIWANAVAAFVNGSTTRNGDTASGTQTIAHGLGRTPIYVRISVLQTIGANDWAESHGAYNGTTTSCIEQHDNTTTQVSSNSTSLVARVITTQAAGDEQTATITVDSTNINLAWTKTGTPSANPMCIQWEAA